jgi:hypothetical protein
MKTITIKLYDFDELSKEVQKKVLNEHRDMNTDFDWWSCTYDNVKESLDYEVEGFNLDRGACVEGGIMTSAEHTANLILEHYGEAHELYSLAQDILKRYEKIDQGSENADNENEKLEEYLNNELSEHLLKHLREEYNYLTSDEGIIDAIKANEYTFESNGKMRNI